MFFLIKVVNKLCIKNKIKDKFHIMSSKYNCINFTLSINQT